MSSTPRSVVFTLLGCVALATAPAAAQDVTDPVDPLEDQALAEEAQARFDEALSTFRKAFDAAVRQAAAGNGVREKNLARAEVLLEKIDALTERVTRHDETDGFLGRYDGSDLGPVLEGHVRYRRARYRLAEGDRVGAARLAGELGFLRDWWIIGPFDNERGRGFNSSHEPEKGIDLTASYKGKERPVAWRPVPVMETLGFVDLDALLRPNDQASAYAVAFVKSDAARPATVRLGSDEAVKAWWNGKEILERDVRRQIGFDQDVVGVAVAEGWNTLLVKVHDQTGSWGFRARLTAPDGSPLGGVTVAATDAEGQAAAAASSTAGEFEGAVAAGAKTYYEGIVGDGQGARSRDLFHLGVLHSRRQFDSFADRKAETLLKQAAELEPENAIYRFHYAEAAAPPTEMAAEKEENRQRIAREKALQIEPGYAVAYRALASYYTSSLVNLDRAENLLRKALEINPDYLAARLDLARVLERRGLAAAAQKMRDAAFEDAKFKGRERAARAFARELERRGQTSAARDAWKEVLRLDARGNDVRRKVAALAGRAMERDEALDVLAAVRAVDPYDTTALVRRAELHEGAGELDQAAATLREALRIAPEDDRLLQALGRVQMKSGRTDEALASFREALRVNPKLQDIERYVEFLDPSAAPYEDDHHIAIEPLIEKAKGFDNAENDGWITLLDQIVNKVNEDGTSSTYVHMAAKVLTDVGVRQFDRYRARARGSAFKWKLARVIKPDGSVVDATLRRRMADFPPLQVGDVIDVEYRADERRQGFFGDYFGNVNYFADRVPMLRSTYTLVTPASRKFYFHTRHIDVEPVITMADDGATRVYTWNVEDCKKVRVEPQMPAPRELFPQVQISTYESWDAFAKWYWSMIRDQHIASDEIKAKVAELVEGKESRQEKIRALFEFVTGEVTYQAWPFGVHGYKPYTTTAIFDKREGDCKDKSILLNTMLREIGVDAYPVLIMREQARSEEDFSLAMVNHFNHCITYVPDLDGEGNGEYLDGTNQYSTMGPPDRTDRGGKVLIVKPEGGEITTIPRGTVDETGVDQTWKVQLEADGGATLEGEFAFRGDFAMIIRSAFSVEGQQKLRLQAMLAQTFRGARLESHEFSDLKDLAEPVETLKVTVKVRDFAQGSDTARDLPTRFLELLPPLGGLVTRPEREHDIVFLDPLSMNTSVTYHLPDGWTSEAPPADTDVAVKQVAFSSKATQDGSALSLSRRIELREPRIPKTDYEDFRKAVVEATSAMAQTWKVSAPATPNEE